MLDYEDLNRISVLKRMPIINAEKDYLQNIILFSIYSIVGKEMVFKGGTCLYKIYKLNRFSEDLDFTAEKIDIEKISNKIISDLSLLNIKGRIKEIKDYKNEINVRLLFNGPLYKGSKETQCFIPLNISLKEKVAIEPKKEVISSIYKEIPNFEVFAMDETEILAEKVRTIFTRRKPRDIYDLHFLLKKGIKPDLSLINRKLSLYSIKFEIKEFKSRIQAMEGLWKTDLKNLNAIDADFKDIKQEILKVIQKL